MKKLLLIIAFLFSLTITAQNTVQIGTGATASGTTLYGPVYRFSSTSTTRQFRSNILYQQSELAAVGIVPGSIISALAFYKTNAEGTNTTPFSYQVYMANSSTAPPLATTTAWTAIMGTHTLVYTNSNHQVPTTIGWHNIPLQTPFTYTGGSLEIAFEGEFVGPSPFTTGPIAWQYTSGFATSIAGATGSTSKPTTLSGTVAGYKERPNIQITFSATGGSCANAFSNFTIGNISSSGAQLSWTPGTGNSSFYVEYGLSGFTKGSGTKITGTYPGAQPPLNLNALSANTVYDVYLGEICNSGMDSVYTLAAKTFTTAPLCNPPTAISIQNVNSNSVTFNYSSSASNIDIEWGTSGFTLGSGCMATLSNTSTALTISNSLAPACAVQLQPTTAYQFYVRSNCVTAGNGTSPWTGPFSFTTTCAPVMAPYLENFESNFTAGAFGPGINPCFKSNKTTFSRWEVEDATGANENSSSTGPFYDNTNFGSAGGFYLYLEASGGTTGDADTLKTPIINISNLTSPYLTFAYHMYGSTMGSLKVDVWNGSSWAPVVTISGQQQSAGSDPWLIFSDTLKNLSTNLIQLRFIGIRGTDFYSDMSLDDVRIMETPLCPWPTGLKFLSSTATTATVKWDNVANSSWNLEWGPKGFSQGTGATATTSVNPYTITNGIVPNAQYDLYVRRNCGPGNLSNWSGPLTFRTQCNGVIAPYSNSFDTDAANTMASCWSSVNKVAGATKGIVQTYTLTTPFSAPNHMRIYNGSGTHAANDSVILISPQFTDLPVGDKRVQFYAKASTAGTQLVVGTMSSVYKAGSFDAVDTIILTTTHTLYSVNITSANGYQGTHQYVAFLNNHTATLRSVFIDDFVYQTIPACPGSLASSLSISNLTSNSVTANWTGGLGDITKIEWGSVGFLPGTNAFIGNNTVAGSVNSLHISGLNPQTTYEFYIRDSCNLAGYGAFVGPFTFSTLCAVTAMPFYESFDNWPMACWQNTGTSPWLSFTGSGSDKYARANFWSVSTGNFKLTSQPISISQDAQIRFAWSHLYSTSYPDDQLLVIVKNISKNTTDTLLDLIGPGFTSVGAANTAPGQFNSQTIILDPVSYTGDTIVVTFWANTDFGPDLYINDVYVENAPACPPLVNLNTANLTDISVTLGWGSTASATQYEVWYGPQGFYQGSATTGGTKVLVSNPTHALSGLTPQTCYEYVVRAACGTGTFGPWSGTLGFCTNCSSQLSGTYTVGSTAGPRNFLNFNDVAVALNGCGISGPVVFNISSGTYNEQMLLDNVVGTSAVNTITFRPAPANTAPVIITFNASSLTDNYIFQLKDMSHVRIKGLTFNATGTLYSRAIDMIGAGSNIIISDNILNGKTAANSSSHNFTVISNNSASANMYNNCVIKRNVINGGSFGIYIYGNSAASKENNNIIDSNTVNGYSWSGISVNYQNNARIRGNVVTSSTTNTTAYGIYSLGNEGVHYLGNKAVATGTSTSYGLYLDSDLGTAANPNRIVNNTLSALNNTGTAYAMYVYNNTYSNIYHNSLLTNAGSATLGRTLYLNASTTAAPGNVQVINNSIINLGPGVAAEISTNASSGYVTVMDYNNIYSSSSLLGRFASTTTSNLANWKTSSGKDLNSVSGNPVYISATDLHSLGSINNNVATPLASVTTDIDGDVRSTLTPDIGADEYTPVSGDLAMLKSGFIKGFCLTANDSIIVNIKNIIGLPVDFSIDPLTVNYVVSGPKTTSGSVIINTGTLNSLDTLNVYVGNIDLSVAGTYTLNASINPNGVNTLAINDVLNPAVTIDVKPSLRVSPSTYTMSSAQDSIKLCVESSFFSGSNGFFMSEIAHYKYTVGAPVGGWPAYLLADDYIEITGVPGSDLGGITLEQWSTTALMNTHTFPPGTVLSPAGTAIIAIGQATGSSPSPANFYYHGNVATTFSSGGNNGRILKDANGNIIDAVGVGATYTFPSTSGVTPADWSGFSGNHTTMSGVRLTGSDLNNASNWVLSSVTPQNPNVLNSGVPLPNPLATAGLSWSLNGVVVDTASCMYAGPFTSGGTYTYIATYSNACGTFSDTSIIMVPAPIYSDAKIAGIKLPSSECGNPATPVKVVFSNQGLNAIVSLPVTVNISGAINTTLNATYSGNLAQYAFDTLLVGTINTTSGGNIVFNATVNLTGDQVMGNNNITRSADFDNTLAPIPTAATDSLCGSGNSNTLYFPIGSTDKFVWLSTKGDTLGTTDSLIVGPLGGKDTTFLLSAKAGITANVGPVNNSIGSTANFTDASFQQLYFTAHQAFTLEYVTVYPNGNGNVNINLVDFASNAVLQTVTVAVTGVTAPGTMQRIAVNMPIPAGTYKLHGGGSTTGGLWRNSSGAVHPYSVPGVVDITGNSFGAAYYYYFYDWQINTGGCAKPNGSVTLYNSGNGVTPSFTSNLGSATTTNLTVGFNAGATTNASSYSWNYGDGNSGSGVTSQHTYTANGTYVVTLIASGPCGTDSIKNTIVINGISLSESELSLSLNLYPNPTKELLNIELETTDNSNVTVRIMDLSGKEITNNTNRAVNGKFQEKFDISSFAKGVYLVEIQIGDQRIYRRIAKN